MTKKVVVKPTKCPSCGVPPGSSHKKSCTGGPRVQVLTPPKSHPRDMPKTLKAPEGQIWIRWVCECCKKTGLFTIPKNANGTWPCDIALGIHRTMNPHSCMIKDMTMTRGKDGIFEMVFTKGKSAARTA